MGMFDKAKDWYKSRKRVEDVEAAHEEALLEEEAREQLKDEKRQEEIEKKKREFKGEKGGDDDEGGRQARGRGGSSFNPINIIMPHKNHFLLILIFLVALLVFLAWRFDFLDYIFFLISLLLFLSFIGFGFVTGFGKEDKARLFISVALFIWLLDMLPANFPVLGPFFGPPYRGYEFDWAGALSTNWLEIGTSALVFIGLYILMVFNIIRKNIPAFVLAFFSILILNNIIAKFFPQSLLVDLSINIPYWHIIFIAVIVVGFIISYKLNKKFLTEIPHFFSYLFMLFVFSFFWINNGWMTNMRAWFHAIFIIIFGLGYIRPHEKNNPIAWHVLIVALIIADFYGYGFLANTHYLWVQFIPILVLFVVTYCYLAAEDAYALVTFIFIVTVILLLSLQVTAYTPGGTVQFREKGGGADFSQFFNALLGKSRDVIERRLQLATGGYYTGNVEQNRYESLGVYFSNIRAADPNFYTNEPITIWSSIQSKTYKDTVILNYSCYRTDGRERIRADKIFPNTRFPIFTLEEIDTECTFFPKKEKEIKPGSNIVTLSAEYNFGTDAYLKAYFIDRERFRAYSREGIDLLDELKIQDKNPRAVFTNGPVMIGMGAGPLITVSEGYIIKPQIGITISNRGEIQDKENRIISRWDGKIKNITELVLLVPPGIEISQLDKCTEENIAEKIKCPCNMPFKEYKRDDCVLSCKKHALDPCTEVCDIAYTNPRDIEGCKEECRTTNDNCVNECNFLFKADEGGSQNQEYKGYALDAESEDFKKINKDIDSRTFECRMDVSPAVLDANPITTRYFRARARYNYLLENSVSVNVEQSEYPIAEQEELFQIITEAVKTTSQVYFTSMGVSVQGFDPDLIWAIAIVESGSKHCCQESYGGAGARCERNSLEKCPTERTITSGTSFGIMQIRYNTPEVRSEVNKRVAKLCAPVETIFDFGCNIKVGVDILNDKRNFVPEKCTDTSIWKNRDDPAVRNTYPTFLDACENGVSDSGIRYSSYEGIAAAIRGYNGWGRDARFDGGYVEKVLNTYNKIKSGQIKDETGIRDLLESRSGQGMAYDETYE